MKRIFLFLSLVTLFNASSFAQGAKNIKINEVLTNNKESMLDEYGEKLPWIELANTSFSTYDIRGMYITTDKATLNKGLSVPDRIKMMSQIPNGSERTTLSAQEHVLYFLNSNPAKSDMHLDAKVNPDTILWIGLFDGNAVDLIDSVTVPVLSENCSLARIKNKDKEIVWEQKQPEFVTPSTANISGPTVSKIDKLKKDDPHGFGITILSMGVVFTCLALLYIAFWLLGRFMNRSKHIKEVIDMDKPENRKLEMIRHNDDDDDDEEQPSIKPLVAQKADEQKEEMKKEISPEIVAAIAQAIKDYQDDVHVEESGVITLLPKHTPWTTRVSTAPKSHW
ncbi:MAG: OadG family protein [Bacteroidaceae bacterium]|nr:OadG family protein [Bacteroidaceae bacterium]